VALTKEAGHADACPAGSPWPKYQPHQYLRVPIARPELAAHRL